MSKSTLDVESSRAVKQWAKLCADRALADLPYKIETNRSGKIIMSPASNWHTSYQSRINMMLWKLLPQGEAVVECAVKTSDGIKVPDAAWMTLERFTPHKRKVCYLVAPEICVEVASPSNSRKDMMDKKRLYFEAGAEEVWLCDKNGSLTFYSKEDEKTAIPHSKLCPEFPKSVDW